MTNKINTLVKHTLYSYNPDEFLPIYIDGQFANKSEFALYKTKQLLTPAGRAINDLFVRVERHM